MIQYSTNADSTGDAIANGFVYRGELVPALRDKLVFGDVTSSRIWYAQMDEVLAADDDNPTTVAPIYEIDGDLRRLTEATYRARGKGKRFRDWQRSRGRSVCGRQRR